MCYFGSEEFSTIAVVSEGFGLEYNVIKFTGEVCGECLTSCTLGSLTRARSFRAKSVAQCRFHVPLGAVCRFLKSVVASGRSWNGVNSLLLYVSSIRTSFAVFDV
jgi:hypothetical protein